MILLDTHALVWWVEDRQRLSARALAEIERHKPLLFSVISLWELAMLIEKGRVAVDRDLVRWLGDLLEDEAVAMADLSPTTAINAARLRAFHGDPADRILYATALELNVPFVSKDQRMHVYARRHREVRVVW